MLLLRRIPWLRVALAWGMFTAFMLLLVYVQASASVRPLPWRDVVLAPLLDCLLWMLFTPLIFWLAARFDLSTRRHRFAHFCVHAGASLALTITQRVLSAAGLHLLGVSGLPLVWSAILATVNVWVPLYWMLLFVAYALELYDKFQRRSLDAVRLEAQLAQAQLQALKEQLNPHFLFNTLNAVTALIGDDPAAAQRMTAKLGEFLRLVLDHSHAQQVPLAQELHFIKLYLEMEQVRFSDRLAVTFQIAPAALPALVPHLLLQPLVENAVRHGLNAGGTGKLHIQADRCGEQLVLEVRDSGPGVNRASTPGLGLTNSHQRLRTLYGEGYLLALRPAPEQGTTVHLELPFLL
ncbi:MAG: sensor histidine kinase [Hymenobacter sp.]|nr:MAG: sensor histidine kinase [Hymenobacter sp.]